MYPRMRVYLHAYICICMSMHIYAHAYIYLHACVYVYLHVAAHHVAHPVGQTLVHVSNTLLCPPCPRHRVRNSVVLVMPTAVLVDSVILSQPLPAPSPFVELCLSEGVRHLCLPPLNPGRCRPHPAVPPQTVTPSRARFHDLRHVCVCLFACMSVRSLALALPPLSHMCVSRYVYVCARRYVSMHSFVLLLLHA